MNQIPDAIDNFLNVMNSPRESEMARRKVVPLGSTMGTARVRVDGALVLALDAAAAGTTTDAYLIYLPHDPEHSFVRAALEAAHGGLYPGDVVSVPAWIAH